VGISRLVMGSVAHAVLTHAHCSVMVVKQPHEGH
jgi:nucleotide-binding universal stress UspA family protein